ncbi:MAG: glycosyltransferase family 2 protein [Bacteroidales bacterium]
MKISVCMATYNGEKYIKEQLDSILCQIGEDSELIISDDGSTDSTLDIVRAYNDERIKVVKNENRQGVVGNFENALKNVSGDYIFLSDQDDVWLPNKVEICVNELQNFDFVVHNASIINESGNITHPSFFTLQRTQKGFIRNFIHNGLLGCCFAFNAKMKKHILPIPNVSMHDIWIALIIALLGTSKLIDAPLLLYRRHQNNASQTSEKSTRSLWNKIRCRLTFLYYISKRILKS